MLDGPFGYSVAKAGEMAGGLSRASVYRAIARGDLTSVRIGGRTVVTADSLRQLMARAVEKAA